MKLYDTVIIGSGYFSMGYAATHENTLIVEETQLADPHLYGTLASFTCAAGMPKAPGAAALYRAFEAEGIVAAGRLSANETEPALCRFLEKDLPDILLGTFCTDIAAADGGYEVTLCNNEGLGHVFAKRVIDTRIGEGNCLGVLFDIPRGEEPVVMPADGVRVSLLPAFYDDQRLLVLAFDAPIDINEAKCRALPIFEDGFRAVGARVLQMSYRMFGAPPKAPYRDERGILHVDETAMGGIFAAYEKGELWNDDTFGA